MAKEVFMPKAGMDMKEGVIIKWLFDVGAEVKEGDALLEIETDKVTMEIESPADGTLLAKYFEDGATVPVVTVIGYVGAKGEQVPQAGGSAGPEQAKPAIAAAERTLASQDTKKYDYDAAVIGGGPAGYVAAIRAAMLGGRVVLFEKDTVGGTCLNRGCIPTKTYLKTAEYLHHIRGAKQRGIHLDTDSVSVQMKEVYTYKQRVVRKLTGGVAALLKSRGVETVKGEALLQDEHTVLCGEKTYEAGSILLCGGSMPGGIPIPGIEGEGVLNSDSILELTEIPSTLTILGGGVIGCEMAMAFSAFGSKVTVVELMDRLLPAMDEEIAAQIKKSMQNEGIRVLTGKRAERIERTGDGLLLYISADDPVEAENILVSIGRAADLSCMGAISEKLTTERGRIVVDEHCRTNIPNIYACGDITTMGTLAHAAFKMGEAAAANAMGYAEQVNVKTVPACLYTLPEAAGVGLTEEQAKQKGNILVGRFPYAANGRAIASGETEGFVKVIADGEFGEILGVHIVGGTATELIMEAKALMDLECTVHEAADMMHAHPTYAEALMEACADALSRCIHLPAKKGT